MNEESNRLIFNQCLEQAQKIVASYRAQAPEGVDPQNSMATIAAVVSAGAGVYGAVSANKAGKAAKKDAEAARKAQAAQIAAAQGGLESLYGEQRDPVEVFMEIMLSMPGLLDQVLTSFRKHAKETAVDFTKSNLNTFDIAIKKLFPKYGEYQDERLRILEELNPQNLGKEEILATTRKLSPLIPEGTFDPKTGAVQGGTQNAVSLYRNLVSGMYEERRNQYLGEVRNFLGDAENSALRQQERASSFLPQFLGMGFESASQLTDATLQQEQQNIAQQNAYLQTLLQMPLADYNPSYYDGAVASNIQTAISGLGSAASSYFSKNKSTGINPNAYAGMSLSGGKSIGAKPAGLTSYKYV